MDELKNRLLNGYKELFEKDPNVEHKGAMKISRYLSLSEKECGYKWYGVHKLLLELKKDGFLEQKKGKGFRLKKQLFSYRTQTIIRKVS